MRVRDVLTSPWLTLALGVIVLVLAGSILYGPQVVSYLLASPTPGPGAEATTAPTPSPSPTPAEPSFVRPTPSPQPTFITVAVAPGQTLTSIAKAWGTTPRSIAWWNRGTYPSLDPQSPSYRPNAIKVGWRLALIPGQVVDDNNPPSPSPGPPAPSSAPTAVSPSPS